MAQIHDYMEKKGIDYRPTVADGQVTVDSSTETTADRPMGYIQERFPVVLVLEVRCSGKIGYYFVSHVRRRIFWLEEFDFSYDVGTVSIEHTTDPNIIGLQMKSQYWMHNEYFPNFYELTDVDVAKADNIFSFALGDVTSSETSTVNVYTASQLEYIQRTLHLYEQKSNLRRRGSISDARTLFRALRLLYDERFQNLYGGRCARLDNQQSIYKSQASNPFLDIQERSTTMRIISLLMLGGPAAHAGRLRGALIDERISVPKLTKYAESVFIEWRDVALYSTVLLSANISFLAIQSIDAAGSLGRSRSHSQRASYISIGASIASIASSLVLLNIARHRELSVEVVIQYNMQASRRALETFALAYALPLSLTMWALISFAVAFFILWFKSTDRVVLVTMIISCLIYAVFMALATSALHFERHPIRYLLQLVRGIYWGRQNDAQRKQMEEEWEKEWEKEWEAGWEKEKEKTELQGKEDRENKSAVKDAKDLV